MASSHALGGAAVRGFAAWCGKVSAWMATLAAGLVYAMVLLTVADVTMRYFGHPILGSYELVGLMGAGVVGLAMPKTSLDRGHVEVDLLTNALSRTARVALLVVTRLLAIALFALLAWYLIQDGIESQASGLVSSLLQIPEYYLVYALAVCSTVQCLALAADLTARLSDGGPR